MNYYNVFGLIPKFDINLQKLSKKFYVLQKKYHPDLNLNCTLKELEVKTKNSILINQGYKILKNPLTRGEHLLNLNGVKIDHIYCDLQMNKNFLNKQFQLNEKLESLKNNIFQVNKFNLFLKYIFEKKDICFNKMRNSFLKKEWIVARDFLLELLFLEKIQTKVEKVINKS